MKSVIGTDIQTVCNLLQKGEVVAIPTETVYGLAANAYNKDAVLSIFRIKNRPDFDPLIIHTHSIKEVSKLALNFPEKAKILANKFWPGPLTLVLPKSPHIPYEVTSGLETVGIRIPSHPLTLKLLQMIDFPLAAPSANPFGYVSPTNAKHVEDQLGEKIPYILDGGNCDVGIESTIISFENEEPVILRKGKISKEEIESMIGPVSEQVNSSSNPKAPGMLLSHYAPLTPLVVYKKEIIKDFTNTGFIGFKSFHSEVPLNQQMVLSATGDLIEAARSLYAVLRKMDEKKLNLIYIELCPELGIGKAINDRIFRATKTLNKI